MKIWAILPAAGIGRRMGSTIPKQYLPLNGVPVIRHSLQVLSQLSNVSGVAVVIHSNDSFWSEIQTSDIPLEIETVIGGDERNESVLNGLRRLPAESEDWVLVHDAVRPCVTVAEIEQLIDAVTDDTMGIAGGLLASPIANTLKKVDASGIVEATIDRSQLWNALTPQIFRYGLLVDALLAAGNQKLVVTDEASAIEMAGHVVKVVPGSGHNIKITHAADLALAEFILSSRGVA